MTIALCVLGALFAVAGAAFLLLGRGAGISRGRFARMARMGRLSAALSASFFGARVRRLFASKERKARIDSERRKRDAARVTETMGQMKGALMKLGQMISFVSDDIPAEYRAALASLQTQAPPMDFALLRDVAERELGRPLERAFARFDAEPLASASIGQVHRAQLPSGEEVAVKIQYPGVAEAIRADLDNFAALYRMGALMYPGLDPAPIIAELRARIGEELDYRKEAENQRTFVELYLDHPFIRIPKVIATHSTERVLTSEFVAGRRFADITTVDEPTRNRYGEIIYRFIAGSINRYGIFNGDPHPGNYLFDEQGRVVFLDFGCVKYFPSEMLVGWQKLVRAHLLGDRPGFRAKIIELGFFPADTPVTDDALEEFFGYFYAPFAKDRPFTFTKEYNARSFQIIFKPEGHLKELAKNVNLPPDFVLVNRFQWGVYSILAALGATGNFHRVQRELLFDDPPSSELGQEDARFRAQWLARRGLTDGTRPPPHELRKVALGGSA